MPKCFAFDVDETLVCSAGPIPWEALVELKQQGHVVGLCGNLKGVFKNVPNWWETISFTLNQDIGPLNGGHLPPKDLWLRAWREIDCPGLDDYVLVGNEKGVTGGSDDKGSAERSGWRFLHEHAFAAGER
jgi:hypothetical protein